MRACQIQDQFGLDNLKLNSLPDPQPGPGQASVRVRAVSLNFRDLLVVKGLYSKKVPLPLTICSDAAGDVVAVGPGATRVKAGDRVAGIFMPGWLSGPVDEAKARTALGAFAQGVLAGRIVMDHEALVQIPGPLSYEEAATLPCTGVTAWNALFSQGELQAGQSVLTQGTGGVSLWAVQLAKAAGARVIATTSSDEKAARLKELGADEVINYKTTPDWEETARKLTGSGVDHVVEVGGAPTLPKSIRAAKMGARIYMIGNRAEGATEFNPVPAFMKSLRLQGVFVGSRDMFEDLRRFVEAHRIRPVVDRVFEFDQAIDALRHFEAGQHFGKVCIRVA